MATNGDSRLSLKGEAFRNELISRNIYNLEDEYKMTDKLSLRNKGKVADSIASILSVVPQYKHFNLENSLVSRIGGTTPLTEIGTVMLGQQMFYNSVSHLAQQNLPSVNFGNVLKGKNPFTKNIDLTITKKENNTFLDKVGGFVSSTYFNTNAIGEANPFDRYSTNADYIRNTGKGQLGFYYDSINLNIYKQVGVDKSSATIIKYGQIINHEVESRFNILNNRIYFDFTSNAYWKYSLSKKSEQAISDANNEMRIAFASSVDEQEYAPNYDSIAKFGKTNKNETKKDIFNYVSSEDDRGSDVSNQLVWGRDGVSDLALQNISSLHGDSDEERKNLATQPISDFKVETGLLAYTKNLLNSTEGNFIDMTRKAFKDGDEIVGFNGSPHWQSNGSTYAQASGYAGKTGIRQHSVVDQYDRFAKAIRFKGNVVYGGNPNSVVHQTVLPRIHPTLNENNTINNKNLMFSIENLAVHCVARDTYGVIDDEWGSAIPLSEVGPFQGRIMWFPPYDLQLSEVAMQRSEATVMLGRNEPMYNYQNSERTVTVSFVLLVDYPEQLRNYRGDNKHKEIADFFAFGGDAVPTQKKIEELSLYLKKLEDAVPQITGEVKTAEPESISPAEVVIHFPNDMPVSGEEDTIIDKMFAELHYEVKDGCESAQDGNGFGLNEKIFYTPNGVLVSTATTKYNFDKNAIPIGFSQYTATGLTDNYGGNYLNKILNDVFRNETNREYYEIVIDGGSSRLFLGKDEKAYNLALGDRRVAAAKKFVESRLKALFGADIDSIQIVTNKSKGSAGGSDIGATPEGMSERNVKQERVASIKIRRNNKQPKPKEQPLNQKEKEDKEKLMQEIDSTRNRIAELKNIVSDNLFKEREKAILRGYEAASKNNYYPAFHTQTPEDFHRRLTFLQQCVRQGAAKRYDVIDEKGEIRARNSVFGRQPICILRVGDFFYTKVIVDNVTVDYNDTTWDMNPEGFGMQPMMARVTLQLKLMGGQSLSGPIDALQNAVSFNYYANSNFTEAGMYALPSKIANAQEGYSNGILRDSKDVLVKAYNTIKK